ncbi:MAG: EF-hand domain-containing protein [Coleofasciculus sp. C1-SOL-03]|jgi:hypothetical protein|uniref:EF-hand domain-containing protein n=1 Tax=Coleofasciculus sp. C1-SOL-03 TaxID=3069522 RepID=UPI003300A121
MVSQQGDRESRLRLAFSVFDEDGSGHICANELKNVMSRFGLTDEELQEMIKEVDRDGDAFINFEEFCQLVPEQNESSTGYHDSHVEFTEGDRIYHIYSMLKPTARLSGLHLGLQKFLDRGDEQGIQELCKLADTYIKELEKAVLAGNFLQDAYSFDPTLEDNAPYFTPEEEEFARSGVFVEVH